MKAVCDVPEKKSTSPQIGCSLINVGVQKDIFICPRLEK